MKTKPLIIIAAAFGIVGSAYAEEAKPDREQRKLPPEVIAKFDKDGDGELNEEERAAAKAEREEKMKEKKQEMIAKFDKDGDGELNEEERKAARAAGKQMMLEKFDKDGDGTLNDDEKAAMREAMKDRPGGPRAGGGKKHGPRDGAEPKAAE